MSCDPPVPWWLFPNLAALDAPVVAAVWQRFLAAQFDLSVPWAATAALVAVVWAIYLADRWLDARRGAGGTDRHRIAARRPRLFAAGAVLASGLAAVAVAQLPGSYTRCGGLIGLGMGGYFALVHLPVGDSRLRPGAKEFLVGLGFAAGVAVPFLAGGLPVDEWLPSVTAFAALCWMNCRLIDRWESATPFAARTDGLLGAAVVAGAAGLPVAVGLAVVGAAVSLLAVHLTCRSSPRAARVLADAALLTPLTVWTLS